MGITPASSAVAGAGAGLLPGQQAMSLMPSDPNFALATGAPLAAPTGLEALQQKAAMAQLLRQLGAAGAGTSVPNPMYMTVDY